MKKNLIIFIPSIEDGGVEKNLFIVANYLSKKIDNIEIITCNNNYYAHIHDHTAPLLFIYHTALS